MNQEAKRIDSSGWEYLKGQVKETLSWLSRHKWAATGLLLFVPAICWYNFITVEKIPISIASPSVVASVSIIFSLMAFFIISTVIYVCAPIVVFFTPVKKNDGRSVAPDTEEKFKKVGLSLFLPWILIQVFIYLAFLAAGQLSGCASPVLILFLWFIVISWMTVCLLRTVWWAAIFSTLVQMLIVYLVFIAAFAETREEDVGQAYTMAFLWPVAIAIIQLCAMKFLKLGWFREGFLKRLILTFSGIMVMLVIYPASSSFMLGQVLQITSSGARSCAVVYWAQAGTPVEVKALGDEKRPGRSLPLRIFLEMDGYYIVRILREGKNEYVERKSNERKDMSVRFIPRPLVAGIDMCPSLRAEK